MCCDTMKKSSKDQQKSQFSSEGISVLMVKHLNPEVSPAPTINSLLFGRFLEGTTQGNHTNHEKLVEINAFSENHGLVTETYSWASLNMFLMELVQYFLKATTHLFDVKARHLF